MMTVKSVIKISLVEYGPLPLRNIVMRSIGLCPSTLEGLIGLCPRGSKIKERAKKFLNSTPERHNGSH